MTSYLSKESISVAVPDVTGAKASFVYNFYQIDESSPAKHKRVAGSAGAFVTNNIPVEEEDRLRRLLEGSPRYVEISFDKSNENSGWANETLASIKEELGEIFNAADNKFKFPVQSEIDINTQNWSQLDVQDIGIVSRLQGVVTQELGKIFSGNLHTMQLSQTDMTTALNQATSGRVSGSIINALVSDYSSDGVTYYDRDDRTVKNELFVDAANVKLEIQFDQKFSADAVKIMMQDALSPLKGGLSLAAQRESEKQDRARESIAAVGPEDYKPKINCIKAEPFRFNFQGPKFGVCGYVIEKFIITSAGSKNFIQSFFLEGSSTTSFVDTHVAYGFTYIYEIKTLSLVEMNVDEDYFNSETRGVAVSEVNFGGGLVSRMRRCLFAVLSRPTRQVKVVCVDPVPPPPPDLLTFRFDYELEALVIDWKFPHSRQRDIKKFQVFKRSTIQEGFTLIAQYDFSDAIFELAPIERVIREVDYRVVSPVVYHVDEDFGKSGDAIYSVVSVDAHHLTSNYSDQIRVRFDRIKNSIETTPVSPLGAPKQYPNFLISATDAQNIETIRYTEDIMKDSGHQKMRIYLDPEVLHIKRGETVENNIMVDKSSRNGSLQKGSYKFQILNVDRQKMKIIDVGIVDNRHTP